MKGPSEIIRVAAQAEADRKGRRVYLVRLRSSAQWITVQWADPLDRPIPFDPK